MTNMNICHKHRSKCIRKPVKLTKEVEAVITIMPHSHWAGDEQGFLNSLLACGL